MTGTELILPDGTRMPVRDRRTIASTEVRDPRGSTMRTGWTSPTLPQVDEWNAEQAFRLGVMANVIAYRCVQLRARAASRVPLVAGRRMGDATTIVESSPITKLLGPPPGGPAPKLSAVKLLRWTFAQKIVTGRRAWEIETDGNDRPVAFWPLAAAHLRAHPSQGGTEWFRLFEYGPSHDPVRFQPDDVFYGWEPSGNDFRQAESELQSARFDLSLVNLCDRHSIGFLRNNAVPAAIITTTAFPDEAHRRRFLANWSAEFGGPENNGKVALNEVGDDGDGPVGDSIDVKVLGLSAKDSRLVEQRRDLMQEVAIALGTPWSKLDASGRTFDNAEAEDRDWWENTILPDLLDLQDDINMQLAPRFGSDVVWFDLREVRALRRRIETITQKVGAPALVQAQIMQINEARVDYGLEPVDDGDRFMTAEEIAALSPSAASILLAEPAPEPTAPEPPALPPAVEPDDDETVPEDPPARTAVVETRALDPEAVEMRRSRVWRISDAVARQIEGHWERAFRRLFARQEESTLSRLKGKRGRQALGYGTDGLPLAETRADPAANIDPAEVFSVEFWRAATADISEDLYDEAVTAGLNRLSLELAVDFDLEAPYVRDFVQARTNQLAGPVTQTTYDAITRQLADGVGAGETIDELADRIRTVFTQASESRATTIARTEVISAYNGASALGAAQLPNDVIAAQEWVATRDGRTRDAHAGADGQTVLIGQPFEVGGAMMAYPGDPSGGASNTVNCRCTIAFLTPEDYADTQAKSRPQVETRTAKAMLGLVRPGEFDLLGFRRALEGVAA